MQERLEVFNQSILSHRMNKDIVNGIIQHVTPYTMVCRPRLENNIKCIESILQDTIEGDVVEIGVWKGGSIMSMILANQILNGKRTFHLFDTFEGMTSPTDVDRLGSNNEHFTSWLVGVGKWGLCISGLEEVQKNIESLHYPSDKVHYHKGDICKNTFVPEKIAVLRLDTDFYESTKHELATFYDSVVPGGYVLIDDYGWWKGCRKAVDEWLINHPELTLIPIDDTGVYFRKPC